MAEKRTVRALLCLLFPPRCASCGMLLPWSLKPSVLCEKCMKQWENERRECCGICANRIGECLCQPEEMEKARGRGLCTLVNYNHQSIDAPQNRMIYRLKKVRDKRTPSFLAGQLAPHLRSIIAADREREQSSFAVCYIPRGRSATLKYGTDQAKELARAIAMELELPLLSLLVRQRGHSKAQKHLTASQRVFNARHAYRVKKGMDCSGLTLLLVDDIVTTGASMASCIRLLRKNGAKGVYGVSIAVDSLN